MGQYSIKDVETLSGVKAHTLRIWEQRYKFLKPKRTDTNIRYYTDEQLRQLLNISTLNRNGYKISRIAEMSAESRNKEVLKIFESTTNPDSLLDSLIQAMIDFNEARFEKALSTAIARLGFEATISELVFPLMERTGILWATGDIQVVQEHFISNLVRRKISAVIDALHVEPDSKSRKFILFLPEGEKHELVLLFTEYVLRKHNHLVTYLGASLPLAGLDFVVKQTRPDYLITFFTIPIEGLIPETYIKKLCSAYNKCKVITGGSQLEGLKNKLPDNCLLVNSLQELVSAIN